MNGSSDKEYIKSVIRSFPKVRLQLNEEYQKIYVKHYMENREGGTKVSRITSILESWGHRMVAKSAIKDNLCGTQGQKSTGGISTLEIGAGTLNQFKFEKKNGIYDIVEPFSELFENSGSIENVDNVFADISEVDEDRRYDRITSVYAFEHILNLPEVIALAALHLKEGGVLAVAIPNEGRFLWHMAYKYSSGIEFKRRYGLDYEVIMRHEHVNTADEIDALLSFFFRKKKRRLFGLGRDLSLYRFYECSEPDIERCRKYLEKIKGKA
ncbi:MAG: methyltransferase domain-containing protein [Lachnospiraceae bacterium]|nr:methyltransferase domain-containing protein [Lachnospiraceae bacterium]